MIDAAWDKKIDDFYEHEFDESDPHGAVATLRTLAAERPAGDAAALFELGAIHDALGLNTEAIPFYQAALEAGLEGERATRVFIQLASTLRNVGESTEAISMLESAPSSGDNESARQAFLALDQPSVRQALGAAPSRGRDPTVIFRTRLHRLFSPSTALALFPQAETLSV